MCNLSINSFIHSFSSFSFFKRKNNDQQNNDTITNNESSNNNDNNHPKTSDQSSVTDESSFGSCEPGTSVVLQELFGMKPIKVNKKFSFI
jgi:hypothetical protein